MPVAVVFAAPWASRVTSREPAALKTRMNRRHRSTLFAVWLLAAIDARMIAPLRRSTALKLLRRLAEGSQDLLSIDIGGTLAKVMLYQPCSGRSSAEDGQPPPLHLGSIGDEPAFHDPEQLELSLYAPELKGNLHFFVFETRHLIDVISFVKKHWPKDQAEEEKGIAIRATGGGSVKHASALRAAGIQLGARAADLVRHEHLLRAPHR